MHEPRVIPAARIARPGALPSPRRLAGAVTAAAAALALVLAAALPARAGPDSDDLAKALVAAVVIGALVNEAKKKDAPGVSSAPVPEPEPVYTKKKPKHGKGRVPAYCAIEFEGDRRSVTVYPESCLLDAGVSRKLPYRCGRDARIYGQWDVVFSEKCLREAGFSLQGRHD